MGRSLTRRQFLTRSACAGGLAVCGGAFTGLGAPPCAAAASRVEAQYWKEVKDKVIRCNLCPRGCVVACDERGFCGARENSDGAYYTMVYERIAAKKLDPVEKDPLYHFKPGTMTLAIATAGCNLDCSFCQSWQIAQSRPEEIETEDLTAKQVVDTAVEHGCKGIAYTYTEPVNFIEYTMAVAEEARARGLYNVCHTAAYVNQLPLKDLCQVMDAFSVDLKGASEEFYRDVCGNAKLQPVVDALETIHASGRHLEITTLVLPGLNDDEEGIVKIATWIAVKLSPNVPYHLTKFFPQYRLKNLQPTPRQKLEDLRKAVYDNTDLKYVYIGNEPGHGGQSTYCPKCLQRLVWRVGYTVRQNAIRRGRCPGCGLKIPGVW